jgi:multidrug transporter EmrE-like cation transporter
MRTVVLVCAMIALTVAANLLMKIGAQAAPSALFLNAVSLSTALGLVAFGVAGVLYSAVLAILPLNIAQSYAAAQFISVIVASYVVLGERISAPGWLGISMIAAGIITVAVSRT